MNLSTTREGGRKKQDYFEAFSGVARWLVGIRKEAERKGYVETLLHKRRRKPSALQASNSPVQGGAGDIVKMAQLKMDRHPTLRKIGFRQLMQIHDEVISEVPEEYVEVARRIMQNCMEHPLAEDLIVPLVSIPEIGNTWNEAK